MHLNRYCLRNFRRLENVEISLEGQETVFVGANNAGKTSATAAFKLFSQRNDFKIHDFSANLIRTIDDFGISDGKKLALPKIELDLWFTVDPDTEYGRVAFLLPSISTNFVEVGMRLDFSASDPVRLIKEFREAFPATGEGAQKTLSEFLNIDANLKRFFGIAYYKMIVKNDDGVPSLLLDPLEARDGKSALTSLLRIDFVEAQRNIDDDASARSNRLSSVFYDFYTSNLKLREHDNDSLKVIEKSNADLTDHYATEFLPLMEIIGELGFPTLNDRDLKVISNLSPEKALGGNALLSYLERDSNHMLPEAYNGLGFKNLVYIAIQVAHFQLQWIETSVQRPLCQLIFIEEPEVHLHAQVQQTFLRQIRKVIFKTAEKHGAEKILPQLVLTTHSSHIVAVAEFRTIRYFRKIASKFAKAGIVGKNVASEVLNLAKFDERFTDPANLSFLKKYIALTHCDLFFADAAIVVEGTVERLLMPTLIARNCPDLDSKYLTVLELGGAYAHKFVPLLAFLSLPSLIVTDLDSVDPAKNNSACIASHPGAVTGNACIKSLLLGMKDKPTVAEKALYDTARLVSAVCSIKSEEKQRVFDQCNIRVAFQTPVLMPQICYGDDVYFLPRTFEESFIFHNIELIKEAKILSAIEFDDSYDALVDYHRIFTAVKDQLKKVEFVLNIVASDDAWVSPDYIVEGLTWLDSLLKK